MGLTNDELTMKLIMDAVNNMSPKVDQAVRDMDKLSRAYQDTERKAAQTRIGMKGSLLDSQTWSVLMKDADLFNQRMDKLSQSGMNKIMTGSAILAPVVATVTAAGNLEEIMNQIKIDTYDSSLAAGEWERRVAMLKDTTVGLSREVKFSAGEIGEAVDSLVRGNVQVQDVANGAARAAVYLAQASRGEVSTGGAAEAVAKLGNAWQQTGKEMEETADLIARVDAASIASIPALIEGFKYVASTSSNLKHSVRETAIALGVLNNAGLDGSTAGTTLNMMLQSLQPTTKAAQEAFELLGLSVENNPFYDVNGRLKPMAEIIRTLRNATKDMTDQQKQLAFGKVFDERGTRAVINLIKEGKNSYEDIEGSLQRQMSLWERVKLQNEGLNAQVEILKGNVVTLLSESGSPLGKELTGVVKAANDATVAMTDWTKSNPELTGAVLKTVGAIGSFTVGIGVAQFLVAKFITALAAFLSSPVTMWITGVAAAMYGARKASPYIPGTDAYSDRVIKEEYDRLQRIPELAAIPTTMGALPKGTLDPWYKKWALTPGSFSGTAPGWTGAPADQRRTTIHVYTRDAQEAATVIRQHLNSDVDMKYIRSRGPIETMVPE